MLSSVNVIVPSYPNSQNTFQADITSHVGRAKPPDMEYERLKVRVLRSASRTSFVSDSNYSNNTLIAPGKSAGQ